MFWRKPSRLLHRGAGMVNMQPRTGTGTCPVCRDTQHHAEMSLPCERQAFPNWLAGTRHDTCMINQIAADRYASGSETTRCASRQTHSHSPGQPYLTAWRAHACRAVRVSGRRPELLACVGTSVPAGPPVLAQRRCCCNCRPVHGFTFSAHPRPLGRTI